MHLIHPFLMPRMESTIGGIADRALANAVPLIRRMRDARLLSQDPVARAAFFGTVHDGFREAQDRIVDELITAPDRTGPWQEQEQAVLRKLSDSIAWQLIQKQLCIARRVFREHRPPVIDGREIAPLIAAARHAEGGDRTKFALISDLTSFIQIGDLLVTDPLNGSLGFVEVKTGSKNERVLDFLARVDPSDPNAIEELRGFQITHGVKAVKQIGRVLRQHGRMAHVAAVLNTGQDQDPDSQAIVTIPPEPIALDNYDGNVSRLLTKAADVGWAIEVIDECLYLGAYSATKARAGLHAFRAWLDGCGWRREFPVAGLMEGMLSPLALPVFLRHFASEEVFDLLFGRAVLFMGLHLDSFVKVGQKRGVTIRWNTRKEAAKLSKRSNGMHVDNRVPIVERDGVQSAVTAGTALRVFFHGTTPNSAIDILNYPIGGLTAR